MTGASPDPPEFLAELERYTELKRHDQSGAFWYLVRALESLLIRILSDYGISLERPTLGRMLGETRKAKLLPDRFATSLSLVVQHRNLFAHGRPGEIGDFSADMASVLDFGRWYLLHAPTGPGLEEEAAQRLLSSVVNPGPSTRLARTMFVCYAKEDHDRVSPIYDRLVARGHRPWMDKRDLLPGQAWESAIEKAIKASDFFLACISSKSVSKRGFVQKEVQLALDVLGEVPHGQIFLIPVRLEPCDVPPALQRLQWLDVEGEESFHRLFAALEGTDGAATT
jgi:hypothetical protein